MPGKAIVCGGSIGGLFAAAALRARGWEVDVYERTGVELSGRGAGIVTHAELIEALEAVGAGTEDLGVAVERRVAYDKAGEIIAEMPYPQIVTSWDRIHRLLRVLIPDENHHLGRHVTSYTQDPDSATVVFEDGGRESADLVVGADGFRSVIRNQMQPAVQPEYGGYVVWRALAQESALPPELHTHIFADFGFFAPNGEQVIAYPIAGEGNDLRPGHRRYNFVWYSPVPKEELDDMLTDDEGKFHAISIPPPLVREAVLQRMEDRAAANLSKVFVELLDHADRAFFTPIYDHLSPSFGEGRVALSGDAACVARPHVGMGVTKAACDALALARLLDETADIPSALKAYTAERVPASRVAYERSQKLGTYIFSKPADGDNLDGRSNPNLQEIMEKTAVVAQ